MRIERLTPRGPGGVALVSCSGPGAARAMATAFVRDRDPALPRVGRLALGRILDVDGAPVDEVLLVRTGSDAFEVGCHGGPAVVDRVHAALRAACAGEAEGGPRRDDAARPPEDRVQAEARGALPLATTDLGCQVLLRQLAGSLSRHVAGLEAHLQATAEGAAPSDLAQVTGALEHLLGTARLGAALFAPPQVAFVGLPNAGKSSLMNALLGKERVLVSPGAGTTRDAVADAAVLDGVPAVLVDTAGRRETRDDLEAAGIARAEGAAASAALRLVVVDGAALTEGALDLAGEALAPKVLVLNKGDLLSASERDAARARLEGGLVVSATTGEGLGSLRAALRAALVGDLPDDGPVLFTPRQVGLVQGALRALGSSDPARAAHCLAALRG